jgi:hypothetical protein
MSAHQDDTDPYIYASMLQSSLSEHNPVQSILGDIGRMAKFLANFGKSRKMTQARLEQMNQQMLKVQEDMASVNPSQVGIRLNKLR